MWYMLVQRSLKNNFGRENHFLFCQYKAFEIMFVRPDLSKGAQGNGSR